MTRSAREAKQAKSVKAQRPRRPMIEAEGLTKFYGGYPAIEGVTFSVSEGEIVGFLGPNGAGKTTTMRLLAGFMPPTSGAARIAGFDTVEQSQKARRNLGYLPESVALYTELTVQGYLQYMGALRGMDRKHLKLRVHAVIDQVQMGHYRDTLIGKLSKGYRQRLGVAQAILHEPPVLVLDEPTIGIDPTQMVETRQLIRDLGEQHTILLSTHILSEVSMLCHRVVIINEGQIVADGSPESLAQLLQGIERFELEARGPASAIATALRQIEGVLEVTYEKRPQSAVFQVEAVKGRRIHEQVSGIILGGGWVLARLQPLALTLEEIFVKLTKEDASGHA